MKQIRIISALFLIVILAECSHSSDTMLNSNGVEWIAPTEGTVYIYQSFVGAECIDFDTLQVLATGLHLGGKTSVVRFMERDIDSSLTYLNYEPDGDISFGDSNGDGTFDWGTMTTGSKQSLSSGTAVDTFREGAHIVESFVCSYVGNESLAIDGMNLQTIHIRGVNKDYEIDTTGFRQGYIDTIDFWFAPSLGIYVKENDLSIPIDTTQQTTLTETDLIKYEPK